MRSRDASADTGTRRSLMVLVSLTALVPVAAGLLALVVSGRALSQQISNGQSAAAAALVSDVDNSVTFVDDLARSTAHRPALVRFVADSHSAGAREVLLDVLATAPAIRGISLYDTEGALLVAAPITFAPSIENPLGNGGAHAFPAVPVGPDALMVIREPLVAEDQAAGTLVAEISLAETLPGLLTFRYGETGTATIVDDAGTVLLAGNPDRQGGQVADAARDLAAGRVTDSAAYYSELVGSDVVVAYAPVPGRPWGVLVDAARAEAFAPVTNLGVVLLFTALAMAALAAGIAIAVARRLSREHARRRQSEARFRALVQKAPVGIMLAERDGRLVEANPALLEMLDTTLERLAEPSAMLNRIPADDWDTVQRPFLAAGRGEVDTYSVEHRLINGAGETRWAHTTVATIRDESENVATLLAVLVDVTERHEAESALVESEARYRTLAGASPVGIFHMDSHAHCTYTNGRLQEIFGLTLENSLGMGWAKAIDDADRDDVFSEMVEATRGRREFSFRFRVRPAGRDHRWVHARAVAVLDEAGEPGAYVGTVEDITARITAEHANAHYAKALEERSAALARSNADLTTFAFVASHDLQEPLRKISSFLQLFVTRYGDGLDERARGYVDRAVDASVRMQAMIHDLLAYSQVDRSGVVFAEVDASRLVLEAVEGLGERITEAGATVHVGTLPTVRGTAHLLRQVFQNLVGNAIKFRRPDVPPVVTVAAAPVDDGWSFTVTDNGIGIPAEYRAKVFGMFQRLHGRTAYAGSGIGLALCARIVDLHGGRMWVEDAPGGGTMLSFLLPNSHSAEDGARDAA